MEWNSTERTVHACDSMNCCRSSTATTGSISGSSFSPPSSPTSTGTSSQVHGLGHTTPIQFMHNYTKYCRRVLLPHLSLVPDLLDVPGHCCQRSRIIAVPEGFLKRLDREEIEAEVLLMEPPGVHQLIVVDAVVEHGDCLLVRLLLPYRMW